MSQSKPFIVPTVGRRIHYWPATSDLASLAIGGPMMTRHDPTQPFDAGVIFVWGERTVNLVVTDHAGRQFVRTSVHVLQENETRPEGQACAQWMGYQVGQAARTQSAESTADALLAAAGQRGCPAGTSAAFITGMTALPVIEMPASQGLEVIPPKKVTENDVEAAIVSEFYFTGGDGVRGESKMGTSSKGRAETLERLTFCVLVLKNGFTVVGQEACVDPAVFDREIGRKYAREAAVRQVWPLLGYALMDARSKPVRTCDGAGCGSGQLPV